MVPFCVEYILKLVNFYLYTVKPVLRGHSKRRQKLIFKTDYHLMQVKSIAECYFVISLVLSFALLDIFHASIMRPKCEMWKANSLEPNQTAYRWH